MYGGGCQACPTQATQTPTPTNTPTPLPATATPTPTNTPIPATATPTPTSTPIPFNSTAYFGTTIASVCPYGSGISGIITGDTTSFCTSGYFTGNTFAYQSTGSYYMNYNGSVVQILVTFGSNVVSVNSACMSCPTATPTAIPTSTPTNTPTPLPATATPTPSPTPTNTNTPVPATATPTAYPTNIPTASPTPVPVSFTITTGCTGSSSASGNITINSFVGGTGTYRGFKIGNSPANANSATETLLNGDLSHQFTSLADGAWYVILFDSSGAQGSRSVSTNCFVPTATPIPTAVPTSTPTPIPATAVPTNVPTAAPTNTPTPLPATPVPATVTPLPGISFTLTASCPGTNGSTGRLVASSYTGGNGNYTQIQLGTSPYTGTLYTAYADHQWDNLTDGTYYVTLYDSATNRGVVNRAVSCYIAPTAVPTNVPTVVPTVTPPPTQPPTATPPPTPHPTVTAAPPPATDTPTPTPVPDSYTLADINSFCTASGGCSAGGVSRIYLNNADYAAFAANFYQFGGIGGGSPLTCTAIARDSNGNALSTRYHLEYSTGVCWKITAGNFTYNDHQC
jgi:hypothetical protein